MVYNICIRKPVVTTFYSVLVFEKELFGTARQVKGRLVILCNAHRPEMAEVEEGSLKPGAQVSASSPESKRRSGSFGNSPARDSLSAGTGTGTGTGTGSASSSPRQSRVR